MPPVESGELRVESSECCRIPKTNREFWVSKIRRNRERDKKVQQQLAAMGWHCITIWECELKPNVREHTLTSLAYTLNKIFLQDHSRHHTTPGTTSQPMPITTPQPIPHPTTTSTPDAAPQSNPTAVPQSNPTTAPQSTPSTAPQSNPTTAPQSNPTAVPLSTPSTAPQSTPSTAPQSTPTAVPQSNPNSTPHYIIPDEPSQLAAEPSPDQPC